MPARRPGAIVAVGDAGPIERSPQAPGDRTMRRSMTYAGAALALLCFCGAASAKGMTAAQLKALTAALGYDAKADGDTVTIPDQGRSKSDVFLNLYDDGTAMEVNVPLEAIPPEKRAAVPYRALLLANDGERYNFVYHDDGKQEWISLHAIYDTATLNNQSLRKALDGLLVRLDGTENIWSQDNWKVAAAASPAPAPAASAACLTDKGPLAAKNVTLVSRKAAETGDIQKRPDNAFKPGEPFLVYLEPTGFQCKAGPNGHILADIDVSLKLVQGDKVLFEKPDYLTGALDSNGPINTIFYNLSADITGLAPGSYALKFDLHDIYGDRKTQAVVPLTVAP